MRTDEHGGDLPITKMENGQTVTNYPGLGCQHCRASFFKPESQRAHLREKHPGQPYNHSAEDDTHRIDYYHYATPQHPHWFILSDKKSDKMLSNMSMNHEGEVSAVETHPKHQRQGLATKLWNYAGSLGHMGVPAPKHSTMRTAEGEQWAKKVGGEVPERKGRLLSARQMNLMIDFSREK
jgi:GNAT superfamily N-acetyltransferase